MNVILIITVFFLKLLSRKKLCTLLQKGNFSGNFNAYFLNKEMKINASMIRMDVSCYFHSSPRSVFKILLAQLRWKSFCKNS